MYASWKNTQQNDINRISEQNNEGTNRNIQESHTALCVSTYSLEDILIYVYSSL